jgi:exopolyphosphatase/guanosine-5'-triphosphate,3'-diphosphate pyrophosphatase
MGKLYLPCLRIIMKNTKSRLAIIDMGTNTFHILIAQVDEVEGVTIIENEKIPVKLGEGGISNSRITPEAQERGLNTLKAFRKKISVSNIDKEAVFATSALRSATNSEDFLGKILDQTGFEPKIIDGRQEAEFIYKGVNAGMDLYGRPSLIMDIGGGSVEFIIANKDEIFWRESFEIGAQRLKDNFHTEDPIPSGKIKELEDFLDSRLAELLKAIHEFRPVELIGVSGTFDTIESIFEMKMKDNTSLSIEEFGSIRNDLTGKSVQERIDTPGMAAFRAEMIVVALALINWLIERGQFTDIRISHYALKEGILYSMIKNL